MDTIVLISIFNRLSSKFGNVSVFVYPFPFFYFYAEVHKNAKTMTHQILSFLWVNKRKFCSSGRDLLIWFQNPKE